MAILYAAAMSAQFYHDKETRRQGDKETGRQPVAAVRCLPVSRSPCPLVSGPSAARARHTAGTTLTLRRRPSRRKPTRQGVRPFSS